MSRKRQKKSTRISRTEQKMLLGIQEVSRHPFFGKLDHYGFRIVRDGSMSKQDAVLVNREGEIFFNAEADYPPDAWAWAAAHAMLHRAFGHFDLEHVPGREVRDRDGKIRKAADFDEDLWNAACDIYIDLFLADIHYGQPLRPLPDLKIPREKLSDEISIYNTLKNEKRILPDHSMGTATGRRDMIGLDHPIDYNAGTGRWRGRSYNRYAREFAFALSESVTKAVSIAGGSGETDGKKTEAQRAAAWFLNHYPLLGGMAAAFRIREDVNFCRKMEIKIAAVDAEAGEIYINPTSGLSEEEWKFVLAHEFLHAGLMHHKRARGRDPYLWNVACDFVINGWLDEMKIGVMPDGILFDQQFRNSSAEEVYDRIVRDIRTYRKLNTLRGYGKGDVLGGPGDRADGERGVSLDEFFRDALMTGLEYQIGEGRGTIPAGLAEEIRALAMPPIRWDVHLADWFDRCVRPVGKHLSYAHPSRRQSTTPDIPRPRYVRTESETMAATFGVIIDTSGSMSAEDIGKALGSVASYAASKEVPAARVIFCDADAYDAGYLAADEIAGRVKVMGRGGTRLQPAVDLLERAKDFPKDGPILLITDGWIEDHMEIHRNHAFLIPIGHTLPFRPKGELFYFE